MSTSHCPCLIASQDKNLLAISPDLSYGAFDLLISKTVSFLQNCNLIKNGCLFIPAHPQIDTLLLLFAAWRLQSTAFLFSPRTPQFEFEKLVCELKPDLIAPGELGTLPLYCATERTYNLDVTSLLLLTSGSGGSPKIASFTIRQLLDSASVVSKTLQASPQNRWLLSLALHHVGGLGVALRTFFSGGTLIFDSRPSSLEERFIHPNAHFASLVPTQLYRLLRANITPPATHFLIGGAPLSRDLYNQAIQKGFSLSLTYGLTEMSSTVLLTNKPTWVDHLPYLGHPLPGRELCLIEQEIHVRGNSLFLGYGRFASPLSADWFATKDLGRFNPVYGFTIDGRKDFQFTCGGENIQPEEIESAILSHPEIASACVVPKFDPEFGAKPFAFVDTSVSFSEIASYLANRLPKYKIPIGFSVFYADEKTKPNRAKLIEHVNKNYSFI